MSNQGFITGEELGEKLLQSVREMQAGLGRIVYSPITDIRTKTGLSETQFADLLGVPVFTLQEWEQGVQQPVGAASTVLRIAERHPEVLRELAA